MDRTGVRVLAVSGRGKLMSFELATETGELRLEGAVETGGEGPSFAALHPGGRLAYVVNEGSDTVAVIDLEAMALLSVTPSGGAGPAHISVLPGAEGVCVANYGGGTVALFALSAAGTELTRRHVLELGPNPHAALSDPAERFLLVPALGADAVFVARLERGAPGEPRCFGLQRGSGPRHLAFDPLRPRAFLVCEHTSELAVLAWNQSDGVLSETSRLSLLPAGANSAGNTGADVHVHPSGRFAYASNRGHDSLAIIDLGGDAPSLIGNAPTRGRIPRNFALSPGGGELLVANLKSDSISSYRVDPNSGALAALALNQGIAEPFWVGFSG
ncbi:MAG TPA: lactonase family protein [Polyangiaceae bacterium]|nr:lactonase family protein [Polyangiaceae bacterium]